MTLKNYKRFLYVSLAIILLLYIKSSIVIMSNFGNVGVLIKEVAITGGVALVFLFSICNMSVFKDEKENK